MSGAMGWGIATVAGAAIAFSMANNRSRAAEGVTIPAPADAIAAPVVGQQTVVFSGGCFWGVQAVFEHVKGVTSATAGYSGGGAETATYEQVSTGETGHAESVRVTYDPSQVSFGDLLHVFFSVAHDPTTKNRQGPDVGTQYRSVIFYTTAEQKAAAAAYIKQLEAAKTFSHPIVTELVKLNAFYPAEAYHQDYLFRHPNDMYIVYNDIPKIEALKHQLPGLYRDYQVQ